MPSKPVMILILEMYDAKKMYNLYFLSVVFITKCSKNVSYLANSSVLHYYLQ